MLRIDRVLGSRLEPEFSEELHRLEHRGAIDIVNVPVADLARRRLLITTRGGEELAIALPRHQKLFDGAVLLLDGDRAIVVRAASERWLRLEPRSRQPRPPAARAVSGREGLRPGPPATRRQARRRSRSRMGSNAA